MQSLRRSEVRVLDVPAGCGGFSLGAHRAGCDVLGVEMNADACATHRANVGPCDEADMREYHPAGRFDIVIGGVPCQSFSLAGKRGGMRDPRGELYQHLVRIAVEADARAVVLENVRGLLSWRDEETGASAIDTIEREYRTHGFAHVSRCVLNAKHYGVPQSRQRLFVCGFRDPVTFRWPAPTHAERGNVLGLPAFVTVREALGLGLGAFATETGGRDSWQGMRSIDADAPSYSIGAKSMPDKLSPLDAVSPCVTASEQKSALAFGSHGAKTSSRRAGDRLNPHLGVLDRPSATMKANTWHEGTSERESQRPGGEMVAALGGRLAVRQCATLQGFPADFEFTGNTGSQYRQAGNAVPPALGEAVIRAVVAALGTREAVV